VKRKIIVCGATGFIGRNIAEFLAGNEGLEVYGTYLNSEPISLPNVHMIQADLRNIGDVNRILQGMDVIIQAAATTSGSGDITTKPHHHVTDNAVMNSLIFRVAFENKASQVVFFSCTNMYQSSDIPVKENDFNANEEMFPSYFGIGWTKIYLEKMCEFYSRLGNTRFTVIRHSNVYGPYDKYDLERSHVFGATVTKVMITEDGGKIVVWGSGEEERDLLYISDLINFVELVIDKQESRFELYNVGYGSSISIKDLVAKIIVASGKDLSIEHDLSKPSIKTALCLNTAKAKKSLDWSIQVSLDEGIQKTLDWYRANMMV